MGNESLAITADPAQLDALGKAMWRMEQEFGKSANEVTRWGAWYIGKSAKATAKKGRPKRRVMKNEGNNRAFPVAEYAFYVHTFSQRSGRKKRLYIKTTNGAIDITQRNKIVIIRAGLLKSSWHWAGSKAGRMSGRAMSGGRAHSLFRFMPSKTAPEAHIGSQLGYADLAWARNKRVNKDDIVKRAAKNMTTWMTRRIERKAKRQAGF